MEKNNEVSAILAVLTRIYDVQMAILNHLDADDADKVFDAHERGEIFNPPIYLMDLESEED